MTDLHMLSFGYGHDHPPAADVTVDVRGRFRDPHISPELRELTGRDREVVDKVSSTEGVTEYVDALTGLVAAIAAHHFGTVTVAVGCVGGRHRSVVIAELLAEAVRECGLTAEVEHLHVHLPVIQRASTHLDGEQTP